MAFSQPSLPSHRSSLASKPLLLAFQDHWDLQQATGSGAWPACQPPNLPPAAARGWPPSGLQPHLVGFHRQQRQPAAPWRSPRPPATCRPAAASGSPPVSPHPRHLQRQQRLLRLGTTLNATTACSWRTEQWRTAPMQRASRPASSSEGGWTQPPAAAACCSAACCSALTSPGIAHVLQGPGGGRLPSGSGRSGCGGAPQDAHCP